MTPAQRNALAVAWDSLRDAGFDEATLARMAAGDRLHLLLAAAVSEADQQDCGYCGSRHGNSQDLSCTECHWFPEAMRLVESLEEATLSPDETPAAASVLRPEETPMCPDCRGPLGGNHSCRVVPRNEHVCQFEGADCWCAAFPGAGAG